MSYVYYVLPAVLILALIRKYREYKWGECKNDVDLHEKVALVTGANSGIGYEIAKELAKRGAKVIVACRDIDKASETVMEIQKSLKVNTDMVALPLDLASIKSIHSFVDEFNKLESPLHILVNNAGVSYPKNKIVKTVDGFEAHFGVNHLGHFLLTKLLIPNLKRGAPSRVVIVSSTYHQKGQICLDGLSVETPDPKRMLYPDSKLANAYFGLELASRTKGDRINVYTLCPGLVSTGLFRHHNIRWYHFVIFWPVMLWYLRSPRKGAQTAIYCATEPSLETETGLFYRDCKHYKSTVNFDMSISKKLWEESDKMIANAEHKIF